MATGMTAIAPLSGNLTAEKRDRGLLKIMSKAKNGVYRVVRK
jgi:hypothetical protein